MQSESPGSLASSNDSLRPDADAGARFSRRPFVFGAAGGSPPRTAAGPSKLPAPLRSWIPRCRFHSTFVHSPGKTDPAESLFYVQSDSKVQIRSLPGSEAQRGSDCEVRDRDSVANRRSRG